MSTADASNRHGSKEEQVFPTQLVTQVAKQTFVTLDRKKEEDLRKIT
jgi:hypothetical protein